MAGKRQPTALVLAKGKKHLTKAEIAMREAQELHPDADKVAPPAWLTTAQKKRFRELAAQLIALGVMTNLDVEALARLIRAESEYVEICKLIDDTPIMIDAPSGEKVMNPTRWDLERYRDKLWRQTRQGATDFGLNIAGRCRLVAPKASEAPKQNKFLKYAKQKEEA